MARAITGRVVVKPVYVIARDQFGNARFDDWDGLPDEAKEGYRKVMTEAERAKFTMEGYHADT